MLPRALPRRARLGLLTVAIVVPLLVPTALASAQTGPTASCSGDLVALWPGVGFNQHAAAIGSKGHLPRSRTLAFAVPAGTYAVEGVTYDGDGDRAGDRQAHEILFYEFIDATGTVMAASGASADLADGVNEATWAGAMGTVVLPRPAVTLRAMHGFIGGGVVNSVMPSCTGLTLLAPPSTSSTTTAPPSTSSTTTSPPSTSSTTTSPPTTSSTTTSPPSTPSTTTSSTTTAPPSTSPPTTPSTTTTVVAPTTSTVPTQVLPEVEISPAPDPVVGVPRFTG